MNDTSGHNRTWHAMLAMQVELQTLLPHTHTHTHTHTRIYVLCTFYYCSSVFYNCFNYCSCVVMSEYLCFSSIAILLRGKCNSITQSLNQSVNSLVVVVAIQAGSLSNWVRINVLLFMGLWNPLSSSFDSIKMSKRKEVSTVWLIIINMSIYSIYKGSFLHNVFLHF